MSSRDVQQLYRDVGWSTCSPTNDGLAAAKRRFQAATGGLSYRERLVVEYYYGLNGAEPKTLREKGEIFNVPRGRIGQIKDHALLLICRQEPVKEGVILD